MSYIRVSLLFAVVFTALPLFEGCDSKLQPRVAGASSAPVPWEYASVEMSRESKVSTVTTHPQVDPLDVATKVEILYWVQVVTPTAESHGDLKKWLDDHQARLAREEWKEQPEPSDLLNYLGQEGWEVVSSAGWHEDKRGSWNHWDLKRRAR